LRHVRPPRIDDVADDYKDAASYQRFSGLAKDFFTDAASVGTAALNAMQS
jgi:hypothetical protein